MIHNSTALSSKSAKSSWEKQQVLNCCTFLAFRKAPHQSQWTDSTAHTELARLTFKISASLLSKPWTSSTAKLSVWGRPPGVLTLLTSISNAPRRSSMLSCRGEIRAALHQCGFSKTSAESKVPNLEHSCSFRWKRTQISCILLKALTEDSMRKEKQMKFWLKSTNLSWHREQQACDKVLQQSGKTTGKVWMKEMFWAGGSLIQKDNTINLSSPANKANSSSPKEGIVMMYDSSFSILAEFARRSPLPLSLLVSSCFSFSPFPRLEFWQLYYVLECQALELWCPSSQQVSLPNAQR